MSNENGQSTSKSTSDCNQPSGRGHVTSVIYDYLLKQFLAPVVKRAGYIKRIINIQTKQAKQNETNFFQSKKKKKKEDFF